MNYQKMLQYHVDAGADATVATLEVDPEEASERFGVMETDNNWRVTNFQEKPKDPARSRLHPDKVNASMGIYVFNTQLLIPILIADADDPHSSHDFGRDIIPKMIAKYRVHAYNFEDENRTGPQYWRDVGTIDSYYDANMDLVSVSPVFNLYDKDWILRTWQQQYPPAKFVFADPGRMGVALDSIVSGGCVISGGRVQGSVLGYDVRVNSYCDVQDSIIYNHVNVGRYSRIRKAIIDRHVSLPEHTEIGYDLDEDKKKYFVSDNGVVVVVRDESIIEEPEA
jgi:glucose-1-phosphate adenylyltransferase